jgi:hypothetical protein
MYGSLHLLVHFITFVNVSEMPEDPQGNPPELKRPRFEENKGGTQSLDP